MGSRGELVTGRYSFGPEFSELISRLKCGEKTLRRYPGATSGKVDSEVGNVKSVGRLSLYYGSLGAVFAVIAEDYKLRREEISRGSKQVTLCIRNIAIRRKVEKTLHK
jgi:hypothetical protein